MNTDRSAKARLFIRVDLCSSVVSSNFCNLPRGIEIEAQPRLIQIPRNRGLERFDAGELLLIAEPVDQLDAKRSAVQIAVEADQMRLDLPALFAKGRKRANAQR